MTLATIQIDPGEVARFGVVDVDRDHRVLGFEEKPKDHQAALARRIPKKSALRWAFICSTPMCSSPCF